MFIVQFIKSVTKVSYLQKTLAFTIISIVERNWKKIDGVVSLTHRFLVRLTFCQPSHFRCSQKAAGLFKYARPFSEHQK